jgi:hypothetical protein
VINTREEEPAKMTDFIPGSAYRLDIITADETVIVDSWQGQIKASVVDVNGIVLVNVETGNLYGSLIGNIEDINGNNILSSTGDLTGSVTGSVYDEDGVLAFDGASGKMLADVVGNVVDSNGDPIVNAGARSITADSITGSFYGDLTGSITADSVIYGTFNGDFNGTSYGDFFGDTTGTHTGDVVGDVVGDVTGNVTGNLTGELLAIQPGDDIATRLTGHNNTGGYDQWEFYGGLAHPVYPAEDAVARGPIVNIGASRADTEVRANLNHYDGTPVMRLSLESSPTYKADFMGRLIGAVAYDTQGEDGFINIVSGSSNGTLISGVNDKVNIGNENDEVNIIADSLSIQTDSIDSLAHRGDGSNKTSLLNNDELLTIESWGYNGTEYKRGGLFGFKVDGTPDANGNSIPTGFGVQLSTSTSTHVTNIANRLEFNNKGVLEVPVFKARGTTFADRDSMTPEAGMILFNISNNKFQGYTGTSWVDLH